MASRFDSDHYTRSELRTLEAAARRFPLTAEDGAKAVEVIRDGMDNSRIRTRLSAVHALAELERLNQADRLVRLKEMEAQLDADALAAVEAGLLELEQAKRRPPAIPTVQSPSQD